MSDAIGSCESGLDACVRKSCLECCGIKNLSLKCMSWELTEDKCVSYI